MAVQVLRRLYCAVSLIGLVGVAGALRAQVPDGHHIDLRRRWKIESGWRSRDRLPAHTTRPMSPSMRLGNIYIADSEQQQDPENRPCDSDCHDGRRHR